MPKTTFTHGIRGGTARRRDEGRRGLLGGIAAFVLLGSPFLSASDLLTFDNRPMGTEQEPLVFRSFFPNPDLDPEVLARHGRGNSTPRYSASSGLLSSRSRDEAIPGIPAAIGVNAGEMFSYVWDTTECRLLYAWVGGFLDMESYWGEPERGSRKKNDYVPRLVGQLFFKAKGPHPLRINGKTPAPESLRYLSHSRKETLPSFSFAAGEGRTITETIIPGEATQTLEIRWQSSGSDDTLGFDAPHTAFEVLENQPGRLRILIRPNAAETFTGFQKTVVEITEANAEAGEKLYQMFGCSACHTTDGSRNHGPTFQGLAGSVRKFGEEEVSADSDYLRESIRNPNAKHVPGYPAGMMPAYPLTDKQIDSLVLYIQHLNR